MFDSDIKLAEAIGIVLPSKQKGKSDHIITDDSIGVEVELENITGLVQYPKDFLWTTHADGSLRDHGVEYVFRSPLNGAAIINALDQLEVLMAPEKVSLSARTSVHVHVDCTDLSTQELLRLILLYTIFEIPIFKSYAHERYGNHFCLPLRDCMDLLDVPRNLNQGWDRFIHETNHPHIGRYCAFNIKSLFKFGTLEFRHLGGCYQKAQILPWINTCLAFKRACRINIDFKNNFFLNSAQGFEGHLREFFPRETVKKILQAYKGNIVQLNNDIVRGIRSAQQAVAPVI